MKINKLKMHSGIKTDNSLEQLITRRQAAQLIGVSPQTIDNWELIMKHITAQPLKKRVSKRGRWAKHFLRKDIIACARAHGFIA